MLIIQIHTLKTIFQIVLSLFRLSAVRYTELKKFAHSNVFAVSVSATLGKYPFHCSTFLAGLYPGWMAGCHAPCPGAVGAVVT